MPENSYFERRMKNGDELSDIFDSIDYQYGLHSEDKERPITVRIGDRYNYVANNFILFDCWFVIVHDFNDSANWSYAYLRLNDKGIREGGVLIRRDGSYITCEEFLDIMVDEPEYQDYAVVRQYNGLLNIVDINSGKKVCYKGLDADYIDHYYSKMGFYRIAKGDKLNYEEEFDIWETNTAKKIAQEKHIKFNLYHVKYGLLSPSLWFDYIDSFKYVRKDYCGTLLLCNHTIVHLDGKKNFIDQDGNLLSKVWFDECHLHADGTGNAGVLKSESLRNLPTTVGENFDYNPAKFYLFEIDYNGIIRAIK